jgi:hypothetical protein
MSVAGPQGLLSASYERAMPYLTIFTESELLTIEAAIKEAWGRVLSAGASNFEREVDLTVRLVAELDSLMSDESSPVPGFDPDTFETPIRGGEVEDYRGTHLEKRPDLVFRRAGSNPGVCRRFCGLFVECKMVDERRTMARYCADGVARFVKGEYAWAVTYAMMLGYARDGYSLPRDVERHFRRRGAGNSYGLRRRILLRRGNGSEVWDSHHERTWLYVHPHVGMPGPITIMHLWLKLPTKGRGRRGGSTRSS